MVVAVASFGCVCLFQGVKLSIDYRNLCHTFFFIVPELVNLITALVFVGTGVKLNNIFDKLNQHQVNMLDEHTGRKSRKRVNNQVELRNKALCQMWSVIISITLTSLFLAFYSIWLWAFSDAQCLLF
jgi:hypothetical protein